MPNTPSQRTTRSGSNAQNTTVHDVKVLIESCKSDIRETVDSKMDKLNTAIESILNRVSDLERDNVRLKVRISQLERQQEASQGVERREGGGELTEDELLREL